MAKKTKPKIHKLKNMYNGDIVHCNDICDFKDIDGKKFLTVFDPLMPRRKFLVNSEFYQIERV